MKTGSAIHAEVKEWLERAEIAYAAALREDSPRALDGVASYLIRLTTIKTQRDTLRDVLSYIER